MASQLQDDDRAFEICTAALGWAESQDYAGWDPYDGLNSPYLSSLSRNWLSRLASIHLVHKSPINLRPVLNVPKQRNPKGIALFAMSYLNLYELDGDDSFLRKAEGLLDWLAQNSSPEYDLPCWGYNFDWQNARKFFLPAHSPSIVVSTFCARAFLKHYEVTADERSLEIAKGTTDFIRRHINTREIQGHTVFTYTDSDSFVVINANALAAGFFARVGVECNDQSLLDTAEELVSFVLLAQNGTGAWYYSMPSSDSHLSHDNFHTGFVLESLQTYLDVRDANGDVRAAYESGMQFYRENLFEANGAPKFEHDKSYPRDAHAAGQAIRTFVLDGREEYLSLAMATINWAIQHLYDEDGYFYRRQGRLLTDKTPYIRWSQAWMCYGLSTMVSARATPRRPPIQADG